MASLVSYPDVWTQYSVIPCSPCSSGSTMVHFEGGSLPMDSQQYITILRPNQVNQFQVSVSELEDFVAGKLGRRIGVTVLHLLIYLFALNTDPLVTHINNIKLIHRGRPHVIQRACDLQDVQPLIKDFIDLFPTFQLVISARAAKSPLKMSVDTMLFKTSFVLEIDHLPSVTYAEALVKLFKNTTRKLSVALIESRLTPTQCALKYSATDVEDEDSSRIKDKLKSSFKRIFKKSREAGASETPLISL